MGHNNANTTQDYAVVVGSHLGNAIEVLNRPSHTTVSDSQIPRLIRLVAKVAEMNRRLLYNPTTAHQPSELQISYPMLQQRVDCNYMYGNKGQSFIVLCS
jgi:hypothetical protein